MPVAGCFLHVCIPIYTIAVVAVIYTTENFDLWFAAVRDRMAQKRLQARIRQAELGNFGDCESVGEGVSEMRIHYGPGYRVYFTRRGLEIVILLVGGDKSTQQADIRVALELARQIQGQHP